MANKRSVQNVTIAQSAFVSGDIDLVGASGIALLAPLVTSGQAFLQGNFGDGQTDPVSANFFRMFDKDGSAQWSWDLGPGSAGIVVHDMAFPLTRARIEMSVAQSDVRSFTIITALR